MTAATPTFWTAATSTPPLAPTREEDMTAPAIAATSAWWNGRRGPDFVAREIVGQLAIADLVGVQFDYGAVRDRRVAGIRAIDDLLVLRVLLACRRARRTVRELAELLGLSESGIRRAVRDARDAGALVDAGDRRYRTHQAWRPAGRRLVAVELKRRDWRRAAHQAWAYQEWANAAWLVLGQRPPMSAVHALIGTGLGLAYLGHDERLHRVLRPVSRRRAMGVGAVWAAEQALVHALRGGLDPVAVRPGCATSRGVLAPTAC